MIWMQGCRSRAIDNVPVKAFHADLCSLTSSRFRPWIDQRSQSKITLGGHRSRLDARPSMFDGSQVQSTQRGSSGLDGFLEFQRQRFGRATHNDHIRGSSILYAFEQGRSLLIPHAQASCNVVAEAASGGCVGVPNAPSHAQSTTRSRRRAPSPSSTVGRPRGGMVRQGRSGSSSTIALMMANGHRRSCVVVHVEVTINSTTGSDTRQRHATTLSWSKRPRRPAPKPAPAVAPNKARIHMMARVNSTNVTESRASTRPVASTVTIARSYSHGAPLHPNHKAMHTPSVDVATIPLRSRFRSMGSRPGEAKVTD